MNRNNKDTLIIILAIYGVGFIILNWHMSYTCSNYQKMTGKPTKYMITDACYVKTPLGWQRYDEYITRSITNKGEPK